MKFCSKCGKELLDQAVVCINCGCPVASASTANVSSPQQTPDKRKTQISLILGIIGIVFAFLFALVGHIVSIIGIILGIKGYKATDKATGLTLSIIGEVCSILSSIIGAVAVSSVF